MGKGRKLTKPIGRFDYARLYKDADSGPPLRKLGTGATLAELSQDYALFTIAPLVLLGGLPTNPIQEWLNEKGLSSGVWLIPLPGPFIDIGRSKINSLWSTKLWACEKLIWPGLMFRLGTVAVLNHDTQTFTRSLCQELPAPDPIALAKINMMPNTCPMFDLTTFAIDSNTCVMAFEPAKKPPFDLPKLTKMAPLPETVVLAQSLFAGKDNPFEDTHENQIPYAS